MEEIEQVLTVSQPCLLALGLIGTVPGLPMTVSLPSIIVLVEICEGKKDSGGEGSSFGINLFCHLFCQNLSIIVHKDDFCLGSLSSTIKK